MGRTLESLNFLYLVFRTPIRLARFPFGFSREGSILLLTNPLSTDRILIRNISEIDDLTSYLSWMNSPSTFPYIQGAKEDFSRTELTAYINKVNESSDTLQLGIFRKDVGQHIGNIKFHHMDFTNKSSWVGFLIGEITMQNKGIAKEAFQVVNGYLYKEFGIDQFFLGVDPRHEQAIAAYRKMGFVETRKHHESITMLWKRSIANT